MPGEDELTVSDLMTGVITNPPLALVLMEFSRSKSSARPWVPPEGREKLVRGMETVELESVGFDTCVTVPPENTASFGFASVRVIELYCTALRFGACRARVGAICRWRSSSDCGVVLSVVLLPVESVMLMLVTSILNASTLSAAASVAKTVRLLAPGGGGGGGGAGLEPVEPHPLITIASPSRVRHEIHFSLFPIMVPRFIVFIFFVQKSAYGRKSTPLAISSTPVGVDLNNSPRTETFCPLCTGPLELAKPVKMVGVPVTTVMLPGHTVPLAGCITNWLVPTVITVPSTVPCFRITWSAMAGLVAGRIRISSVCPAITSVAAANQQLGQLTSGDNSRSSTLNWVLASTPMPRAEVGGMLETVTLSVAVLLLPAASRAMALRVCAPLVAAVVFQLTL